MIFKIFRDIYEQFVDRPATLKKLFYFFMRRVKPTKLYIPDLKFSKRRGHNIKMFCHVFCNIIKCPPPKIAIFLIFLTARQL